jgi:hypothetical protein
MGASGSEINSKEHPIFMQTIRTRPSAEETDKKQAKVITAINLFIYQSLCQLLYTFKINHGSAWNSRQVRSYLHVGEE